MAAPKLRLDETMEQISRVMGARDEDRDLQLSDLKKPPLTMSPDVELLTRDVKSCRGIHSSPMDTCPSPFHPCLRTVPACSVGDTPKDEMGSYGLATLACCSPMSSKSSENSLAHSGNFLG